MGIAIELKDYKSSIEETSKSDDGISLIKDTSVDVYNFDNIKLCILNAVGLNSECKSADALYVSSEKNVLIEFKRTSFAKLSKIERNKNKNSLKIKLFDSKGLLNILRDSGTLESKKDEAIIVYSRATPPNDCKMKPDEVEPLSPDISRRMSMLALTAPSSEKVSFGLEKMKDTLYDDIHTYTDVEFTTNFINQISSM